MPIILPPGSFVKCERENPFRAFGFLFLTSGPRRPHSHFSSDHTLGLIGSLSARAPVNAMHSSLGGFIRDGSKEGSELNDVKIVVRPDAAAQVQTKRLHRGDGIRDVGRGKTSRE